MSPRKRPKPNPKAPATVSVSATDGGTGASRPAAPSQTHSETSNPKDPALSPFPDSPSTGAKSLGKKAGRKWLGVGGSWRAKAPASIQSSKGIIGVGVAGGAAAELPDEDEIKNSKTQTPAKFLSKRRSSKGNTIPAAMTKLNVSSDGSIDKTEEVKPETQPSSEPTKPTEQTPPPPNSDMPPPLPPDPPKMQRTEPAGTYGWRSWWSRPDGYSESAKVNDTEEAQQTPLPGPTPSEDVETKTKELGAATVPEVAVQDQDQDAEMKDAPQTRPSEDTATETKDAPATAKTEAAKSTSWFWSWSSAQNAQANPTPEAPPPASEPTKPDDTPESKAPAPSESLIPPEPSVPSETAVQPPISNDDAKSVASQARKPAGWAFWFTDKPKNEDSAGKDGPVKHVGEVAVFDTPSQTNPEAAQFNEEPQQQKPDEETPKEPPRAEPEESIARRSFMSLRGRPKPRVATEETPADPQASSNAPTPSRTSPSHSPTRPDTAPAAQPAPKEPAKTRQEPPNLLFPEFQNTYHLVQKPTYWQQIRKYFLGDEPPMPHLHINPAPPRIRKAVAIGIHGFFPAAIIQRVLGQPTGTSIRFATAARKAIDDWTAARGYTAEVQQIALEGEGFVKDRVETLWKLLLNRIEHIKEADFIMVACHSQGVPVAIMLVAKLIQFGCVDRARIGVCAMAGVNMGPFIEYKTKYLGATAAELFNFGSPKSLVSEMYLAALDVVLRKGVRILYVGSIDDQLVSLESSTFSTLSHPYIYRAVFIDGRIHAPDFLTHLVGFALKLRNLGLPDHGLIRELSPALAGSLYGGEGHSRIYDDPRVYSLATQHALETTSLPVNPSTLQGPSTSSTPTMKAMKIPTPGAKIDTNDPYALRVKDYEAGGNGTQNPFFLPWAMRGLLEEDFVKKELNEEVEELLAMFEEWRPTGKQLKDVRFRLEAVKSRL